LYLNYIYILCLFLFSKYPQGKIIWGIEIGFPYNITGYYPKPRSGAGEIFGVLYLDTGSTQNFEAQNLERFVFFLIFEKKLV